jgi:hypothetical protein
MEEQTTCLELLLSSFCKHFELKPKQAAGLLTQKGKYLTHVIAKGLRGKFEPIVSWYQDMYANMRLIIQLIEREEASGSLNLMLSALRPGFVSKSIEVTVWTCRLFAKLGAEFIEHDMQPAAWDVRPI